ncbi:hypothetical protein D3C73_1589530 [compost metagenome]
MDLWAQFFHTEITVQDIAHDSPGGTDECQKLIQYLLAEYPELETLRGTVLRTAIDPQLGSVKWPGLEMSPYTITLKRIEDRI